MATYFEYTAAVTEFEKHVLNAGYGGGSSIIMALRGFIEKDFNSLDEVRKTALVNMILEVSELLSETSDEILTISSPDIKKKTIAKLDALAEELSGLNEPPFQDLSLALKGVVETLPHLLKIQAQGIPEPASIKSRLFQSRKDRSISITLEHEPPVAAVPMEKSFLDEQTEQFSEQEKALFDAINELAIADDGLILNYQSPTSLAELVQQIKSRDKLVPSDTAQQIYNRFKAKITEENEALRRLFSNSAFAPQPLHLASMNELMHDQDMTRVMPKGHGGVSVLAALTLGGDPRWFAEAIRGEISKRDIKHLIIPVGPGHWRGVYLSKPAQVAAPYQLEIFDSFGAESARAIEQEIKQLLVQCGIRNINVVCMGPSVKQTEGYSCGDYVCAYSHIKMKEFEPGAPVNESLINAFERGNQGDSLRRATRDASQSLLADRSFVSTSAPINQPAPAFPTKEVFASKVESLSRNGWHFKLDPHRTHDNQYTIQSIDEKGVVHRDREVNVAPGKISAVLTSDQHDDEYRQQLAHVMVSAALISGMSLNKIKIHCVNSEMNQALKAEIARLERLKTAPSVEKEETMEVRLRPGI